MVPPTTLIAGAPPTADLGDAELLERVRAGDRGAYGVLFERHEAAARALARQLSHSATESDDLVADAFARVLQALDRGAGPTEAFRPYLLTTVRRQWWRRARITSTEEGSDDPEHDGHPDIAVDAVPDRTDEALAAEAFSSLPERWQVVLWHTEVEGASPPDIAKLLDISPNAAAALAHRAREGLRQAFLQAHLQHTPKGPCRIVAERLGAYARDGLGKRDKAKVEAHLATCEQCAELESEVRDVNGTLRSLVAPALLGVGLQDYLRSLRAGTSKTASRAARAGWAAAAVLALTIGGLGLNRAVQDDSGSSAGAAAATSDPGAALGGTLVTASSPQSQTSAGSPCVAAAPIDLPAGASIVWAELVTLGDAPAPGGALSALAIAPVGSVSEVASGVTSGVTPGLITDGGVCTAVLGQSPGIGPDTSLLLAFVSPEGSGVALVPSVVAQVGQVADNALVLSDELAGFLLGGGAQPVPATPAPSSAGGGTGGSGPTAGAGDGAASAVDQSLDGATSTLDQTVEDVTGTVDDVLGGLLP